MDYTTVCLFIHQFKDIWVVFSFWLWQIKLLWTLAYILFCKHKLSFFLGKYPGVGLLNHILNVSLIIEETVKLSSRTLDYFALSTAVNESSSCSTFLPTLGNISCQLSVFALFAISIGKWLYLVVVLISFSLMSTYAKHLLMSIFAIHLCSSVRCLFKFFAYFLSVCLFPYYYEF